MKNIKIKHSNICYIQRMNNETRQSEFVEVDGITVKNSFGFDLFRHKPTKDSDYYIVTEGQTGFKICEIRDQVTDGMNAISSPKEIDAYLTSLNNLIDKKPRHEILKSSIEKTLENGKLSPRYTEPDKRRAPKLKKEPNPDLVLSKCLYEKSKKYFVRIFNENGIQLFRRKDSKSDSCFTVYAPCNGWMITLGYNNAIDTYIDKLSNGFDLHKWIVDSFENQMADKDKWVDAGIAEYLGRREEVEIHNKPIREAREEQERKEEEERQKNILEQKQVEIQEYNKAIDEAENAIRNCVGLVNDNIKTLAGNETSIVLELMRKHNIYIPIKTKGWINNALSEITFKDGAFSYRYFSKSANSTVFRDYLDELVAKIQVKDVA